jgi:uncharacterized membrane protein YdjX (TVP38/TMEM64 family)
MTRSTRIWLALAAGALLLGLIVLPASLWSEAWRRLALLTDRQWIRTTLDSYGWAAPIVFIAIQIGQVVAAPIPGEATGFIGGYLFGTLKGFLYSSISLGIGSLINFGIGRFLGRRFVRRLIPEEKFKRIDRMVNRQGVIAVFMMYIIPGFPKDYLSLILGMTTLPLKVFAVLAFFGRMPGTLVLSLKGASLYDKNNTLLAVIAAICLVLALLAYRYREPLYRWVEKMNPPRAST